MSVISVMLVLCIDKLQALDLRWLRLRVGRGSSVPKFAVSGVTDPKDHFTIATWPAYWTVKLLSRLENAIRVHGTLAVYLGMLVAILAFIIYAGRLAVNAARDDALNDALKRVIVHPLSPADMQNFVWQAMRSKTMVVPKAALIASESAIPIDSNRAIAQETIFSDDYEDSDENGIPDTVERDAVERFAKGSSEAMEMDTMRRRHDSWRQTKHAQRQTGKPPEAFPCTEDDELFSNRRCNRDKDDAELPAGPDAADPWSSYPGAQPWRPSVMMPAQVNSVIMEDVTAGNGNDTLCDEVFVYNGEQNARTLIRSHVCWDLVNILLLQEFAPWHMRSQLAITRSVLVNDDFPTMLREDGASAGTKQKGVAKVLLDAIDQSIRSMGKQTVDGQNAQHMDCVCSAHLGISRLFAFVVRERTGDSTLFIDYNITMPPPDPSQLYTKTMKMRFDPIARPELSKTNDAFWKELKWVQEAENPGGLKVTYLTLPPPEAVASWYGREFGTPAGAIITTDAHEKQVDEALLSGTASPSAKAVKKRDGYSLAAFMNRVARWMKSDEDIAASQQQQQQFSSAAMLKKERQRVQSERTATKATLIRLGISESRAAALRSRAVALPGSSNNNDGPQTIRSWPQQLLLSLGMINESAMLEKYLSKSTANIPREPKLVKKVGVGLGEDVESCLVLCKEMVDAVKERRSHIGNKLAYGRQDAYGSFPTRDLHSLEQEEEQQQPMPAA
jgi:hypothetical protein